MNIGVEPERERINKIAQYFSMLDGFNGYMTKYRVETVLANCPRGTLLDIGSADAAMAEALHEFYDRIVAVEGSQLLIEKAVARLPNIKNIEYVCVMIEEFETDERFDVVLLSFILEHVEDPVAIAQKAATFLKPSGTLFVMVPNANSLHRRVGKCLGLIPELDALNATDIRQGHRRVYTPDRLRADIVQAGLRIEREGTFFIKPFSNGQMELIDRRIADALYQVSFDIPGLGSMIFILARRV